MNTYRPTTAGLIEPRSRSPELSSAHDAGAKKSARFRSLLMASTESLPSYPLVDSPLPTE